MLPTVQTPSFFRIPVARASFKAAVQTQNPRQVSILRFGATPPIVDPTQKGARFITTNRYNDTSIDYTWAAKVEDAAQQALAKSSSLPTPQALVDFIAEAYNRVINKAEFGSPRHYVDLISPFDYHGDWAIALQQRTVRTFQQHSVPKIPGLDPPLFTYRGGGVDIELIPEDFENYRHDPNYANASRVLNTTLPIDGREVTVLKTMYYKPRFGTDLIPIWYFEIPKPEIKEHLCTLIQQSLDLKTLPDSSIKLNKAIETIATLHWLFSCTMPYCRGSAGIADILTKVLFDHLGIETPCWKAQVSPDMEAMATPDVQAMATPDVQEYIRRYPGFFQGPLRFKSRVPALDTVA